IFFVPRNEDSPGYARAQVPHELHRSGRSDAGPRNQPAIRIRHIPSTRLSHDLIMQLYDSLTAILRDAGTKERSIRFIDGEQDESVLRVADLWQRAVLVLGALQARGMKPGDELVIFTRSNETFVVAFWAAVLGGIVPVPVAVGISDEHRLKLFRIVTQLQRGTLLTERDLFERLRDFATSQELRDVQAVLRDRVMLDEEM